MIQGLCTEIQGLRREIQGMRTEIQGLRTEILDQYSDPRSVQRSKDCVQ